MNYESLARPQVVAMKPYASARNSAAADGVLLNANEAPSIMLDDPAVASLEINRYPVPQPGDLVARLASLYGVQDDQVLVTRGSDEGIDLLTRVFCREGLDRILECPPCFGMYRISAQVQGVQVMQVSRDPESLLMNVDEVVQAIHSTRTIKLVFLTSPNNPTGDTISRENLERLINACGERALLVMDEAYIEFCEAASATQLLDRYPQLVVLRTLSKAWAAAGLRCGAVIANPALLNLLRRIMAPYPLTAPANAVALAATDPAVQERQVEMLRTIGEEKEKLADYLSRVDWVSRLWPGEANFILARVDDGPALVAHCATEGVRIRDFSSQHLLENCVRFSIGSETDMAALRRALDSYGEIT